MSLKDALRGREIYVAGARRWRNPDGVLRHCHGRRLSPAART
ncbi:hypothetical protein [Nonomuraea dietziae]